MLSLLKNRLYSKNGASDIMVVIVLIIVFASFAFMLFNPLADQATDAGGEVINELDNIFREADNIINSSL
ncbi:MAG: hypothetical protein RR620_08770 [Clostridium sp.]